jgi:hypothetical protein
MSSTADITVPSFQNIKLKDVRDLQPGDSGWTYPWAVKRLGDNFFIDLNYSIHSNEDLRMCLFVSKDKDGNIFIDPTRVSGQFWIQDSNLDPDRYIQIKGFLKS